MFKKKDKLEYEFLPSALEIEETPASPLGRLIIWLIFLLIVVFLLWSYFAKIDKVAVARGKIIPAGKAKVIEPLEEGTVKAIYIKEGEKITKGQLLLELDTTINRSSVDEYEKYLDILKLEEYLLKLHLKKKFDISTIRSNPEFSRLTENEIEFHTQLQQSRLSGYESKVATQEFVVIQRETELKIAITNLSRLKKRYTLLEDNEKKLAHLAKMGSISNFDWLEKKSEFDTISHEMDAQKVEVVRAENKIEEDKRTLNLIKREWLTDNLRQIVEIEKKVKITESQLKKVNRKLKLKNLYSPVDGTVNQLEVTTIGEVVTPGQALITIVPDNMQLLAEVMVLNRDIGFVSVGKKAEIKLDTFSFQKYGIVEGTVIHVSPDAVIDKQTQNMVYKILIKPDKSKIWVDGKYIDLIPGMTLTAEIRIGRRRIIEFFMDPFMKFKGEAFKQR